MHTHEFYIINLTAFLGNGHCFESVIVRAIEEPLRQALPIQKYRSCIGTKLDKLGVDLQLEMTVKKQAMKLNIDLTKSRGFKTLSVWKKKHFLHQGTVLTQCVLDISLLEAFQKGRITARELLLKGIALWEEIRQLCLAGDFEAVEQYAEQHS